MPPKRRGAGGAVRGVAGPGAARQQAGPQLLGAGGGAFANGGCCLQWLLVLTGGAAVSGCLPCAAAWCFVHRQCSCGAENMDSAAAGQLAGPWLLSAGGGARADGKCCLQWLLVLTVGAAVSGCLP